MRNITDEAMSGQDSNYWKLAYMDTWPKANRKVSAVRKFIRDMTGRETELVGFGAGTDEFIDGSAAINGHVKGDADLRVVGAMLFIEVTGPLVPVQREYALWIRPDKVSSVKHITWIIHAAECRPGMLTLRAIRADELAERVACYEIVTPVIRGRKERYIEVPPNDGVISPFKRFLTEVRLA